MICLNPKGLPLLEELANLRAETKISEEKFDNQKEVCSIVGMDRHLLWHSFLENRSRRH